MATGHVSEHIGTIATQLAQHKRDGSLYYPHYMSLNMEYDYISMFLLVTCSDTV